MKIPLNLRAMSYTKQPTKSIIRSLSESVIAMTTSEVVVEAMNTAVAGEVNSTEDEVVEVVLNDVAVVDVRNF